VIAQTARVRELLVAERTGEPFVALVRSVQVFLHVVQAREPLAAHGADVAARVHAPVVGVLAAGAHLLATDGALERFDACVHVTVLTEVARGYETLSASVTLVPSKQRMSINY